MSIPILVMKTTTWARDSHGLFDQESKHIVKNTLRFQPKRSEKKAMKIVRVNSDIFLVDESEFNLPKKVSKNEQKVLARIQQQDNFQTFHGDTTDAFLDPFNNDSCWLVARSVKLGSQKGCKLSEGDIIKIGRVKFRIRELKTEFFNDDSKHYINPNKQYSEEWATKFLDTTQNTGAIAQGQLENNDETGVEEYKAVYPCRVCLSEFFTDDNPLISPCSCGGTMKQIHLHCLQQWLCSKLNVKQQNNCLSFTWKTLDCELCKTNQPYAVALEGKVVDLIEIPKPDSAQIVLENVTRDKNASRGIQVISMTNKETIRIGRGHESDVRISDISVSRCHSVIRLTDDAFVLEDNNSKFGTLLQVRRPMCLDYKSNFSIQLGRSLIIFNLKSRFNLCRCMSKNEKSTTIRLDKLSLPPSQTDSSICMLVENRLLQEQIKLDKEENSQIQNEKESINSLAKKTTAISEDKSSNHHQREFSLSNLNGTNIANNQTLSFNLSSTHLKGLQNLVTPAHDEKLHPLDLEQRETSRFDQNGNDTIQPNGRLDTNALALHARMLQPLEEISRLDDNSMRSNNETVDENHLINVRNQLTDTANPRAFDENRLDLANLRLQSADRMSPQNYNPVWEFQQEDLNDNDLDENISSHDIRHAQNIEKLFVKESRNNVSIARLENNLVIEELSKSFDQNNIMDQAQIHDDIDDDLKEEYEDNNTVESDVKQNINKDMITSQELIKVPFEQTNSMNNFVDNYGKEIHNESTNSNQ